MTCLKLEEEVLISFFTSNDDVTYVLYSGGSRVERVVVISNGAKTKKF